LIGAHYLDRGIEDTRRLVLRLFGELLDESARLGAGLDWKTSLQELAATRSLGVPEYHVTESGPDHAKTFNATAFVGGNPVGAGEGRSKKEAEQRAAERAWHELSTLSADPPPAGPADG
jgi:ribonuclease-3